LALNNNHSLNHSYIKAQESCYIFLHVIALHVDNGLQALGYPDLNLTTAEKPSNNTLFCIYLIVGTIRTTACILPMTTTSPRVTNINTTCWKSPNLIAPYLWWPIRKGLGLWCLTPLSTIC